MNTSDPMADAQATFQAVVEGRASLDEAREAFAVIEPFRTKGMYDPGEEPELSVEEKLYSDAVNCFKMALDALQANQVELARSYLKVAKIKVRDARGA